jgi:hypothetical protein
VSGATAHEAGVSCLPIAVVAITTWELTEATERRRERLVLPQRAQSSPSWDDLPAVQCAYKYDNTVDAEKTLPPPVSSGAPIGRIIVRAPVLDGVDAPMELWDLEPLVEPFAQLGLSVALVDRGLDAQQIRRLRFGAIRAPFLSVPAQEGSPPVARGVLTVLPLAENILLEVEHSRTSLENVDWAPTTHHRMDPHPVWRKELGNAAGLAAAVALRGLSTLDRGGHAWRHRRTALEEDLFRLVEAPASDQRDTDLRHASRELLGLVKEMGIVYDELAVSRALACAQEPHGVASAAYRRVLEVRAEHERAFESLRADCRETARIASDAASTLTLIEQQAQSRRNEALHRALTIVTAVVLLPGLVAAVFSAKVKLPAEGTVRGTLALVSLMIAFAGSTAWVLNTVDRSQADIGAFKPPSQIDLLVLGVVAMAASLALWLA